MIVGIEFPLKQETQTERPKSLANAFCFQRKENGSGSIYVYMAYGMSWKQIDGLLLKQDQPQKETWAKDLIVQRYVEHYDRDNWFCLCFMFQSFLSGLITSTAFPVALCQWYIK